MIAMHRKVAAPLAVSALLTTAVAVGFLTARADAQAGTAAAKTVWDGAYSEPQARRGEAVYAAECSSCHASDLSGQNGRLIGDRFMRDWREDNLDSLFRRTKAVMPRTAPGTLTDGQYLDIIAYVLQENGFPAGSEDLKAETAPSILLVGKEGPQPVPEGALVQASGCLTESGGVWTLTNATAPKRTRTPDITPDELTASEGKALGTETFRLMEVFAYKPDAQKDHKVSVKGLLIKRPENRINVTGLETIGASCAP
jgi:mono/diheme cytochrome c family protein